MASVRRKTVHQAIAAGAPEVGLGTAALRPPREMRAVPGFRRVIVARSLAVGMAQHRRTLRATCPVLAGAVFARRECGAVRLRPCEHVVAVGLVANAVDDVALFSECGLLGEIVGAVQFGNVLCDYDALGILPRPLANAVPRI